MGTGTTGIAALKLKRHFWEWKNMWKHLGMQKETLVKK
jgi:DNA modification methylase